MCSSLQDRELWATQIAVSMRIPALIVTLKSVFDMKEGNHPWKQAMYAHFRGWRWWSCWRGPTTLKNEHMWLVFEANFHYTWQTAQSHSSYHSCVSLVTCLCCHHCGEEMLVDHANGDPYPLRVVVSWQMGDAEFVWWGLKITEFFKPSGLDPPLHPQVMEQHPAPPLLISGI